MNPKFVEETWIINNGLIDEIYLRIRVYHPLKGFMLKPLYTKLVFARVRSGSYTSLPTYSYTRGCVNEDQFIISAAFRTMYGT